MSKPEQQQITEHTPAATPSASASKELTDTELDQASGGIIFVGGAPRQATEPLAACFPPIGT
jgi:hypothetical protein